MHDAGKANGAADYLSRTVHGSKFEPFEDEGYIGFMAVEADDVSGLELCHSNIARFSCGIPIDETDARLRQAI